MLACIPSGVVNYVYYIIYKYKFITCKLCILLCHIQYGQCVCCLTSHHCTHCVSIFSLVVDLFLCVVTLLSSWTCLSSSLLLIAAWLLDVLMYFFITEVSCVSLASLWLPCVADADIMFLSCGFFFYLLSFFPRLILAIADWMCTILPHMVWL